MFLLIAAAAALLPSLFFAWNNRDLPHLGYFHDDCVYMGTARSLAEGRGFRAVNLPGEPPQTRFPPLFPLYLAAGWRWGRPFPGNLPLIAGALWLLTPLCGYLCLRWCERAGLPVWQRLAVTVFFLLSPYTVFLGVSPMSEMLGVALCLSALLIVSGEGGAAAALAGFLAGAAFLARTQLLPLVPALALALLVEKRWKHALLCALAAAPAIGGWLLWARAVFDPHVPPAAYFYLSYAQYHQATISRDLLPVMIWTNFAQLPVAAGGLFFFLPQQSPFEFQIARLMAIWALVGVVRLTCNRTTRAYAFLMALSFVLLLGFNMPPQERHMFLLLPLLAAGLVSEASRLAAMVRAAFRRQRVAAVLISSVAGGVLALSALSNLRATFTHLPALMAQERSRLPDRDRLFKWISTHTPATATFLSFDDTLLNLRTGRHAYGMHEPPRDYYLGRLEGWVDFFGAAPEFARRLNLDYLVLASYDLERVFDQPFRSRALQRIRDADLPAVASFGPITVYRLR
jgi:hypothetical protein